MPGTLTLSTLSDGTNSTNATDVVFGSARAWVNFNGTGTVAIRASYNVSNLTDVTTGSYRVNFINAMPDTNYVTVMTCDTYSGMRPIISIESLSGVAGSLASTTSQVTLSTGYSANTSGGSITVDMYQIQVAVFR